MEVKSTHLKSVDYNAEAQRLTVVFQSGETYHYEDVPVEKFDGLVAARSAGKFFNENIKGIYPHSRVMK